LVKENQREIDPRAVQYKKDFHTKILARMDRRMSADKDELRRAVIHLIDTLLGQDGVPAWLQVEPEELKEELVANVLGFGPIETFLHDPSIDEIMVNGSENIWIERHGKITRTDRFFLDDVHFRTVIDRMLRPIGKALNDLSPYVDGRLEDGSRINVVIPPLAIDGAMLTIRKFKEDPITVERLVSEYGSFTQDLADFLHIMVRNRKNVVISGGSGAGKTTMLNVISRFIPEGERIVTIEDSAELKLSQPHVGRLEARVANYEGKGSVSIRDLVRNALRMRPDRIVVGECRGGEAIDMLQAMNTGHDGSLTTVHANSSYDVLSRLETMCSMSGLDIPPTVIRKMIGSAIDLIIQVARMGDGTRKVVEVSEVLGLTEGEIQLQTLFRYERDYVSKEGEILGELRPIGNFPTFMNKVVPSEREVLERIFVSNRMEKFS
jgi:pilus assembly protein CpaF